MGAPLLLYSLAEFRELVFACLEAADARSVVEVGGEEATFTQELLAWVRGRGGQLTCVEPEPGEALHQLADGVPELELVKERSPAALELVPLSDAYLLDGDHNYWTVSEELRTIDRRCEEKPYYLVLLHDVGWPCARRDLYYSPGSLPADAVHPYSYERGVRPDRRQVVRGGHRGVGQFAWAVDEGGTGNGVLTAVEDFLAEHDDFALATVPCIFGLGVMYRKSAPFAPSLGALVDVYDGNPLLQRLEENRLELYLRLLEAQDVLAQTELHVRDVRTENRALWTRVAELEKQQEELTERAHPLVDEVDAVVRSRAFAVAERLSRLHQRANPDAQLSRRRLQDALERLRARLG